MQVVQHIIKFFRNSSFVFLSTQLSHLPFPPHPCFLQRSLSETHHTLVFFRAWLQCVSVLKDVRWSHLRPRGGTLASGRTSIIESEQIFLMCQLQLEEWPEWWITLVWLCTGARFTQVRVSSTRRDWWHFLLPGRHAVHAPGLLS